MVNYQEPALDAVFAALADPTRRAMVARLSKESATVGELAAPFAMSAPAISKHLRVLERAGLLERRIDGRVHHLGIIPGPLRSVEQWLAEHRVFWEERLDALVRLLEAPGSDTEAPAWPRPKPSPRRRSSSPAPSRPRARRSSPRGRKPKR